MSDVLKMLSDDHRKVERMFKQLAQGDDRQLALQICNELTMHSTLEEEIVYPVLRDRVDPNMAEEAEKEHQALKELIARVEQMEPDDSEISNVMQEIERNLRHHVEEEEQQVFPKMQAQVGDDDLYTLGNELFARRQELLQELGGAG